MLYIDIDIHHGDGVELAFYHSNRVMTVSFHKYTGDFFPGTGKLDDNGAGLGKHFCLNVPLQDGITDEMYLSVFKTVIGDTVTTFQPSCILLQCGADSLGLDRLGAFNLSIAAHGECVNFVRKFNVPLLVVGGGGYTVKNVSRCWTYETAVLVGAELADEVPATVYDAFFQDSAWKLHPPLTGKVENQNSPASLQRITIGIREKLRYLKGAPSVAMREIPPGLEEWLAEEAKTPEEREEELGTANVGEKRPEDKTMARNEYYDGENDVDQDDVGSNGTGTSVSVKVRGASSTRRARGGRRARGRGRGRGGAGPSSLREEIDEDAEDVAPTATRPTRARRARGRSRGRGRGKAREKNDEREKERDEDPDNVSMETETNPGTEPPTPMDPPMELDVEV